MNKFLNRISVSEYQILVMFLIAVIASVHTGVSYYLLVKIILVYYPIGLFFEYTTRNAWIYNESLQKSPLHFHGFSLLNPIGWVGVVLFTSTYATRFFHGNLGAFVIMGGIVGNLLEQFFLYLGLWKYNEKYWSVTLFTGKPIMIFKIPLTVRLGYFIFGAIYFYINQWIGFKI